MRKIYYRKRRDDLKNRIFLSSQSYFTGLRIFNISLILTGLAGSSFFLYFTGIEFYTLGLTTGVFALLFLIIFYLNKHSYVVSIKEDTIIHTRSDDRSFVTPVKTISKLKSYNVLGIVFTKYKFNLDGIHKTSLIVSKWAGKEGNPKYIIKNAIQHYKKEKANHKPGSVITQQA